MIGNTSHLGIYLPSSTVPPVLCGAGHDTEEVAQHRQGLGLPAQQRSEVLGLERKSTWRNEEKARVSFLPATLGSAPLSPFQGLLQHLRTFPTLSRQLQGQSSPAPSGWLEKRLLLWQRRSKPPRASSSPHRLLTQAAINSHLC